MNIPRFKRGDLVRVGYTGDLNEYVDYTVCLVVDTKEVTMHVPISADEQARVEVPMIKLLRKGKMLEWQPAESYVLYFNEDQDSHKP